MSFLGIAVISWCKKALSPKEGHTAVQVLSSCRLDEMYLIDMNVI